MIPYYRCPVKCSRKIVVCFRLEMAKRRLTIFIRVLKRNMKTLELRKRCFPLINSLF
ncbi:hypothetical protein ACFP3I_25140 [Chryseobacterium arachidis]|uniref:hypothetical protein n=1 Tax=Chryseobacterium arachidis TaxID=1416778 RepID=UPI0036124CCE